MLVLGREVFKCGGRAEVACVVCVVAGVSPATTQSNHQNYQVL